MITQKELKQHLVYNHETGIFSWANTGKITGRKSKQGYMVISINGRPFLAHRLAWLYVNGYMPEPMIDHIDRNRSNNKISNLREVSFQCNMINSGNARNNSSFIRGVSYHKRDRVWQARIKIHGKSVYLGCSKDFDEAVCHRLAGEQFFGWGNCTVSTPAYEYVKKNIQCV